MALRGRIEDFGLADILQLIVQGGKRGVITLSDAADEVRVSIKDAMIFGVENTNRPMGADLASRLAAIGVISGEQLGTTLKRRAESDRHVAEILIEDGIAPAEIVRRFATLQAVDILFEIFTWPSGDYAFEEVSVPDAPSWIDPITADYLLMNCVELTDEWPELIAQIPSPLMRIRREKKAWPPLADDLALADDLGLGLENPPELGPNETLVYELCLPGLQVRTVLDRAPLPRFATYRSIAALEKAGYVRLV